MIIKEIVKFFAWGQCQEICYKPSYIQCVARKMENIEIFDLHLTNGNLSWELKCKSTWRGVWGWMSSATQSCNWNHLGCISIFGQSASLSADRHTTKMQLGGGKSPLTALERRIGSNIDVSTTDKCMCLGAPHETRRCVMSCCHGNTGKYLFTLITAQLYCILTTQLFPWNHNGPTNL